MHGDLLCSDDLQYQQARRHLRNPAVIADFLAKPLEERATLAALYRRQSGEATSLKAEAIMDANPQTVLDFLRRHGARRLIHGHTHRPACHDLRLDGASGAADRAAGLAGRRRGLPGAGGRRGLAAGPLLSHRRGAQQAGAQSHAQAAGALGDFVEPRLGLGIDEGKVHLATLRAGCW
jgi:hypothetical protein